MPKLPIILFPDPILREVSAPVERLGGDVQRLIDDLFETMYGANGVGLAAPQIGLSRRVLVLDPARDEEGAEPRCLINPEILETGNEMRVYEEGCLSMPEIFAEVVRPATVLVRYLNREGTIVEERLKGHAATVAQHEIDHLNGVMFIDHISRLKRDMLIRKFRKARRDESVV
ncbi:MAG: peptide deformylase [Rhodomicrobiaceae bacterium]